MQKIKALIQKFASDGLARNSVIVLSGTMGANVFSYLYHLVMGRILGPSGYGELSSLLSLNYIFTVPLLVAQTVLIKFVSGFKAHGEVGQAKTLFIKATKLFVIVSLVGLPLVFAVSPWVTSFLHLSSTYLFILIYLLLAFSLLSIASSGTLSGYQMFIWMSILSPISILVKLILSIPFATWGVPGVLTAAVVAGAISYGLYFLPLRFLLRARQKPTNVTKRSAFGFAVPTLLTQLGITSLYSTDIILVRHFFSAHDAGLYASLAVLGKIIFFASSAVPTVLFPLASERHAVGGKTKKLVLSAAGAVGVISLSLTILFFLLPGLFIRLLFGNAYTGGEPLLGQFGIFLSLFSVGNILALSNLAVGKVGIWIIPVVAAIVQVVGITMFHTTLAGVILLNIGVSSFFAIGALAYYYAKI